MTARPASVWLRNRRLGRPDRRLLGGSGPHAFRRSNQRRQDIAEASLPRPAELEIYVAVERVKFIVNTPRVRFGFIDFVGGTDFLLRLFDRPEGPGGEKGKDRRAQADDAAGGHQHRTSE